LLKKVFEPSLASTVKELLLAKSQQNEGILRFSLRNREPKLFFNDLFIRTGSSGRGPTLFDLDPR